MKKVDLKQPAMQSTVETRYHIIIESLRFKKARVQETPQVGVITTEVRYYG
jgi:hypothetical protein